MNETIVNTETFDASPAYLFAIMQEYESAIADEHDLIITDPFAFPSYQMPPDTHRIALTMAIINTPLRIWVTILARPQGGSSVTIGVWMGTRPDQWPLIEPAWQAIRTYIGSILDSRAIKDDAQARQITPTEESQRKATIAHYLITKKKTRQTPACDQAKIDSKTYRQYRDSGWLLSPTQFLKTWNISIEDAAEQASNA